MGDHKSGSKKRKKSRPTKEKIEEAGNQDQPMRKPTKEKKEEENLTYVDLSKDSATNPPRKQSKRKKSAEQKAATMLNLPVIEPQNLKKSGTNYCSLMDDCDSEGKEITLESGTGNKPLYTEPAELNSQSGETEEESSATTDEELFYKDIAPRKALYQDVINSGRSNKKAKKKKKKRTPSSKKKKTKGKKALDEEEELPPLLKQVDPTALKNILLGHAKDHRAHMLSYLLESLIEEKSKSHQVEIPLERRVREWNTEFQQILDEGVLGLTVESLQRMADLTHDFVECARGYAKIIVNELSVDAVQKQIKPADVGGIAGGEKYIAGGILFKFCLDKQIAWTPKPLYMYGGDKPSDELAIKVGGLELQGLMCWQSSLPEGLHFPMMCLIDYKGFRLIATSLLPIDGANTLRYGSSDGGSTVLADDPKLVSLIETTAKEINLKKHTVGKKKISICGPGDIEGHKGKDGRYYLLDFARTMPPEAPDFNTDGTPKIPRGVFYRMLRPELVSDNAVPLSSDVFSGWGSYDTNREVSQNEVREATNRMYNERIPAVAAELESLDFDKLSGYYFSQRNTTPAVVQNFINELALASRLHTKGINVRHLGRVRSLLKNQGLRTLVLSLAMARLLKSILREKLRNLVRASKSEMACKELVASFFNDMLFKPTAPPPGTSGDACAFVLPQKGPWGDVNLKRDIMLKFPGILSQEEIESSSLAGLYFCPRLTICECLNLNVMRLSPMATKTLFSTTEFQHFELLASDIEELCCSTRYPLLFNFFDALNFSVKAKQRLETGNRRVLLSAKMTEMVASISDVMPTVTLPFANQQVITTPREASSKCWTSREYDPIQLKKKQIRSLLLQANERLLIGTRAYPLCPFAGLLWGDVLADLAATHKKWPTINKLYEQAYERFNFSQAIVGPFQVLQMTWATTLKEHALQAAKFGHDDLARSLSEQAESKWKELPNIKRKTPCEIDYESQLEELNRLVKKVADAAPLPADDGDQLKQAKRDPFDQIPHEYTSDFGEPLYTSPTQKLKNPTMPHEYVSELALSESGSTSTTLGKGPAAYATDLGSSLYV